ncbi:MAG: hypothetical protein JJU37_11675 [Balneolaceae bacterium]|nr:hypothetical protein [Balneolaceae bacterium]
MSDVNEPIDNEEENEPEIWDEHRWEEFMKESDRRTDQYLHLYKIYEDHPDRDKLIAIEMGWLHTLDSFLDENKFLEEFSIEEYEEGDEWKKAVDFKPDDFDSFENLPIYQDAYQYTLDAMKLIDNELNEIDDESVDTFTRSVIIPPAKIAGGFGFGFDLESIGGNIANCKRGLFAANRMLTALQEIKKKEFIDEKTFNEFYNRGKDVRDQLAIYIVELREQFRRGIP